MSRENFNTTSAIMRSLRLIESHPSVLSASPPFQSAHESMHTATRVQIRLGLPFKWMAKGVSPNGVLAVETATLHFPKDYPLRPPRINLRHDFDRSLAHVQPGPTDVPPEPCIYDGDLGELLQRFGQQGICQIINQLVDWLEKAALKRLMNPNQGWEPVRRDSLHDFIVIDANLVASKVSRRASHSYFLMKYIRFVEKNITYSYNAAITETSVTINSQNVRRAFFAENIAGTLERGLSLSILVTPGSLPSGDLHVASNYQPETVADIASLTSRAAEYGCGKQLDTSLRWLQRCLQRYVFPGTFPLGIVLCARRPFKVIGSDSEIEICPYIVEFSAHTSFLYEEETAVRPAGHIHAISPRLLARLSGSKEYEEDRKWVQVGCGSLGSKIALHLAREGRAPSVAIDKSYLRPHNMARHALLPTGHDNLFNWIQPKATAISFAIRELKQSTDPINEDIISITRDKDKARRVFPKNSYVLVNATAAQSVREALASAPSGVILPRVVDTTLLGAGSVGLMTIEGPQRNPNVGDLISMAYNVIRQDELLRSAVYTEQEGSGRQNIGQGCGSMTTVMPDSRISMFAAPMAKIFSGLLNDGLPDEGGRLCVGYTPSDIPSLSWKVTEVAPSVIVKPENKPRWSVRLLQGAHEKIYEEALRWPDAETGGILIGRFSESAKAFYVVDVIEAPEDSIRSPQLFRLGKAGIKRRIRSIVESTNNSLYCLGTWHSHLTTSASSHLDRATAAAIAVARLMPSVLLIYTPGGYTAVLAAHNS